MSVRGKNPVARTLMGVLIFQIGLGALLIVGDMRGLRLPSFGPDAPRLTGLSIANHQSRGPPTRAPPLI